MNAVIYTDEIRDDVITREGFFERMSDLLQILSKSKDVNRELELAKE